MSDLLTCANCSDRVIQPVMHGSLIACSRPCRDALARKDMRGTIFVAPPRMDLRAHLLRQTDPGDACHCPSCCRAMR
jgi:hypothetical protein